jgi:hypothetical protein
MCHDGDSIQEVIKSTIESAAHPMKDACLPKIGTGVQTSHIDVSTSHPPSRAKLELFRLPSRATASTFTLGAVLKW